MGLFLLLLIGIVTTLASAESGLRGRRHGRRHGRKMMNVLAPKDAAVDFEGEDMYVLPDAADSDLLPEELMFEDQEERDLQHHSYSGYGGYGGYGSGYGGYGSGYGSGYGGYEYPSYEYPSYGYHGGTGYGKTYGMTGYGGYGNYYS